jgi:hypothetical protein
MKTFLIAASLAAGLCVNAVAADFSSYSTEELLDMRGSVPIEERSDFKAELHDRISVMTPEEKARYEVGNRKGQDGSQSEVMKKEQVQKRTQTSLQEGEDEAEELKTQVREKKRLQDRSQIDQMNQMNQMNRMQQMQRTKETDTQGRR